MELLAAAWDLVVHLDQHLAAFVAEHGGWVYGLLFVIVFCETGLVVTPFLPGDSLLFVVGALAAAGGMDIVLVMTVLVAAALCGDNVNYWIGRWTGTRWLKRWINPAHLQRTHEFYERHGGKTIVLARFIPVVRTFAPFVAGASEMTVSRFQLFNIAGALFWVLLLVLLGYFFGNIPFIRQYLNVIVLVGIGAAIVPVVLGALWKMTRKNASKPS
jgi:membrane-associated protein